jgi:hypothetical protein
MRSSWGSFRIYTTEIKAGLAGFSVLVLLVFAALRRSSLKRSAVWRTIIAMDGYDNFDDVQNSETVHFDFA